MEYPQRILVLDHGYVELGDPIEDVLGSDLKTVNAARVSFDSRTTEMRPRDAKLINFLGEEKHTSPFRHSALSLRIKAPLFVAAQWRTHMVASALQSELHSFNEASGRYIAMKDEFYEPEVWRKQSTSNRQASDGQLDSSTQRKCSQVLHQAHILAYNSYQELLDLGAPREQARGVLPQNLYTSFMWTASLQAIANFISLRDSEHAQWEIQQYAKAVKDIAIEVFPNSIAALTPQANNNSLVGANNG